MSNWAVGDLAVCVDTDPAPWSDHHLLLLELGRTYRVTGTRCVEGFLGLHIAEVQNPYAFLAKRFRKVVSDKHEACETEFVTLLQRIKRKQVA